MTGVVGIAEIESFELKSATSGDSLFQAGLLSKSVTAALALALAERGDVDLDGEVRGTTLRDLLGHTAGANVTFCPGYAQGEPVPTLAQSLQGVEPATTPPVALDPNAAGRFRYSGGGYALVQQLIEDVSGIFFGEAAQTLVFDPLGMTQSTFVQPLPEPQRKHAAYPGWRIYPEAAAAGLWTTPADLARFVRALLTRQIGDQMTIPRASLPFRGQWTVLALLGLRFPRKAGLGVFVEGHRFINLGGAAGSFAALTGSMEDGSGAVVMTAGCRSPRAVRLLLELADVRGWIDLRAFPRGIRRSSSGLLLRALS